MSKKAIIADLEQILLSMSETAKMLQSDSKKIRKYAEKRLESIKSKLWGSGDDDLIVEVICDYDLGPDIAEYFHSISINKYANAEKIAYHGFKMLWQEHLLPQNPDFFNIENN